MNTNLVGVIIALLSTNYLGTDFTPIKCSLQVCTNYHHYEAVEHYSVTTSNVVNVLKDNKIETMDVDQPITSEFSLTNYVVHPDLYRSPNDIKNGVWIQPLMSVPVRNLRTNISVSVPAEQPETK